MLLPRFGYVAERVYHAVLAKFGSGMNSVTEHGMGRLRLRYDARGVMSRTWSTGWMVLWVALLLVVYLMLYY